MQKIKVISFITLSVILIILLIEIIGRIVFFQYNASESLALLSIHKKITIHLRNWKLKRIPDSKKAPGQLSGAVLNKRAWEASFEERNLIPPFPEPREGYWGSRIFPKKKEEFLKYIERPLVIPNLINVDEQGFQYVYSNSKDFNYSILILGGSVAYGAYASNFESTYFSRLVSILEKKNIRVEISILATGAWHSTYELLALILKGLQKEPDIVIFFNGLNDLTNIGGDYTRGVDQYLSNMKKAKYIAKGNDIKIIYLLQPFLPWKSKHSPLELQILKLSEGSDDFGQYYKQIQNGLLKLQDDSCAYFIDFSNVFKKENKTTFADLWHFSDPGHEIVAQRLAKELLQIHNEPEKY